MMRNALKKLLPLKLKDKVRYFSYKIYHSQQANPYAMLLDYRARCLREGSTLQVIPKIAFYVFSVSTIDHYMRIWRNLENDQFVVLVRSGFNVASRREQLKIIKFLSERNVPYVLFENALSSLQKYQLLVLMHHDQTSWSNFSENFGIANFYVRYMIQGIETFAYCPMNLSFSLFLCQGNYQVQKVKSLIPEARCELMGYPRMDDYFLDAPLSSQANICKSTDGRETILYMPTHDRWSTLKDYINVMAQLSDVYNVIIKPHPDCFIEHPEIFNDVSENNFFHIIKENVADDWALFKICDYMFVDYGGSVFAAIYTRKKIVFLRNMNSCKRVMSEIENKIAQDFPCIQTPNISSIRNILSQDELFVKSQAAIEKFRHEFFEPVFENSGKYAAAALINELDRAKGKN